MDTTQVVSAATGVQSVSALWLCAAIVEFLIIIFLLSRLRKLQKKDVSFGGITKSELRKVDKQVSMSDLMSSIAKSRELYKELSSKYHPDRFANTPLLGKANKLFQEISQSKRNYKRLCELKEIAAEQLTTLNE